MVYNFDGNEKHLEMFNYVKNRLIESNEEFASKVTFFPFRKRTEHIYRVYSWTKRLIEESNLEVNKDALLIASIFHDSGYALQNEFPHAINSANIFLEYAKEHEIDNQELIYYLIKNHSDKSLLHNPKAINEVILLQEADLLDETGAMSVLWDSMVEGQSLEQSYYKTYEHIKNYTLKSLYKYELRTEVAKKYWEKKRKLVNDFLESLSFDLIL